MFDGAEVGYLTGEQFDRFRRAVHLSLKLVPWLRVAGYIRSGADEVRVAMVDPPLGVPPTWVAAEDIDRLSRELQYWPDLEDVARDADGAQVAVLFTREVETAAHRWPFEDQPHKVRHLRCQVCSAEALRYTPPGFDGDVVTVRCVECRSSISEEEFRTLAALVAAEVQRGVHSGGLGRLGAA